MKKIYLSVLGAVFFAILATVAIAQPSYCLRLVESTVTATTVEVDVQIQFSTSSGLGSSNLQILYDNTRLSSPVLGTDNIPAPFYAASTVTSPTTSKVSYNIELLVPSFGVIVETAPSWTSVGTIIFSYTGATPTTLTWSYTGTTTETVVFDHNEVDQIFATSAGCLESLTLFAALPVELTEFQAQWTDVNQREAILNWTTATESGNERFEIQRSFDGDTWRTIGSVEGAGFSTEIQSYNFIDQTAGLEMTDDHVYYRIAQVDFGGGVTVSQVRSLRKEFKETDINIFPNPFTDEIFVIIPKDLLTVNDGLISIKDVTGRTISEQSVSHSGNDQLIKVNQLHSLAQGVYFLKFESGKNLYTTKVVKQ